MYSVYALCSGLSINYVGYTAHLDRRRIQHGRRSPDEHLIILGAYPSQAIGLEHEAWWMSRLRSAGHQLRNKLPGGGGPHGPISRSPEWRAKIGEANRRRVWSEESRAKTSRSVKRAWAEGRSRGPVSETHRQRLSEATKGIAKTPEHRAKLSRSIKQAWADGRYANRRPKGLP